MCPDNVSFLSITVLPSLYVPGWYLRVKIGFRDTMGGSAKISVINVLLQPWPANPSENLQKAYFSLLYTSVCLQDSKLARSCGVWRILHNSGIIEPMCIPKTLIIRIVNWPTIVVSTGHFILYFSWEGLPWLPRLIPEEIFWICKSDGVDALIFLHFEILTINVVGLHIGGVYNCGGRLSELQTGPCLEWMITHSVFGESKT